MGPTSDVAPSPAMALNHCPVARLVTIEATGMPSITRHSEVANHGNPSVALVEPSSGSTTTVPRRRTSGGALQPALLRQHVEARSEERFDAQRVDFQVDVVLTGTHTRLVPIHVRRHRFTRAIADLGEQRQHRRGLVNAEWLVLSGVHGRGR